MSSSSLLRKSHIAPFSTRATRANWFASVSVPAATLKLRRVGFLISVMLSLKVQAALSHSHLAT
jgi:hypothetical protein